MYVLYNSRNFSKSHSKHVSEPRTGPAPTRPCLGFVPRRATKHSISFIPCLGRTAFYKTLLTGLQKMMVKATWRRATGDSNMLQICCDGSIQEWMSRGVAGLSAWGGQLANSRMNCTTEPKPALAVIILQTNKITKVSGVFKYIGWCHDI